MEIRGSDLRVGYGSGAAPVAGAGGTPARRSLWLQLAIVFAACALCLVPSVPSWHGDPDRHSLAVLTLPVAVVLLALYLFVTTYNLRIHRHADRDAAAAGAWTLPASLAALAGATVATAAVSEILVPSLEDFAHTVGLSEFFIAVVIVAIVGNAAEHGGAIVIARRGKMR